MYGGWFYGNHGIYESTLDALYRRGLVRYEKRVCRVSKFERAYAVLTDKGHAHAVVERGKELGLVLAPVNGTYTVVNVPKGTSVEVAPSDDKKSWNVMFLGKWRRFGHLDGALEYAATVKHKLWHVS